ncbi:peptide MFS transporter [Corynebacterium glaucum]|uniref:peptide MFS transporter n=1 Tax=Corynebacterium glaucum TaxID=187491 RepID=UPI0022B76B32|nr:oligopeptide:H+ symporter [Corynebacterium glaucum]
MTQLEHRSTARARTPSKGPVVAALAGVEAWERFSFYGMQAILVYYLYRELGMAETQATALVGAYGACLYLFAYVGGWFGDRVFGPERTLLTGCGLLVAGHLCLAFIPGYAGLAAGLLAIALGSGLLKTAAITLLGLAFPDRAGSRDAAFQIFYLGINVGALFGPLLTGWLAQQYGFHVGFGAAAVLMVAGAVMYLALRPKVLAVLGQEAIGRPAQPIASKRAASIVAAGTAFVALILALLATDVLQPDGLVMGLLALTVLAAVGLFVQALTSPETTKEERSKVLSYIPLFICSTAYWGLFAQTAGVFAVYSDQRLDRTIGDFTIPAPWTQSLNPFYILVFSLPIAFAMARFAPRRHVVMGGGLALAGAGMFLLLPFVGGGEASTPFLALAGCVLCMSLGELFIGPVGMSSTGAHAPAAFRTRFAALYFLTMAIGTSLAGTASVLYDSTNPSSERAYLLVVGLVPVVIGLTVALRGARVVARAEK